MPIIICPIKLFELNQNIYIQTRENELTLIDTCLMEKLPEVLVAKCEEYNCETIHLFTNDTFAQEIGLRVQELRKNIKVEVN